MLGAFGAWLCLHYGRLGFMPLDQSIVFDGGWRILQGQRPFADFALPAGLVPSLMQAALFAVGGVSWFVYSLHAAVLNGLFVVVVAATLIACGLSRPLAWFCGAASAVLLYPPFGVPYPDQHSFFFSACCLLATVRARQRAGHATLWLAVAPVCGALAAFSKPIPAAFVILPCGVALILTCARRGRRSWGALLTGCGVVVLAGLGWLVIAGVSSAAVYREAVVLPLQTARARTPESGRWLHGWRGIRGAVHWTPVLIEMTLTVIAAAYLVGRRRKASVHDVAFRRLTRESVGLWLIAEGLVGACWIFVRLTNNQAANGVAFLFLAGGLALAGGRLALTGWPLARLGFTLVLLAGMSDDAVRFNQHVNATRIVHDQTFDASVPRWSPGGRLAFMQLNDRWHAPDLRPVLHYIASRPEPFLLMGDSSVLYGATGHRSTSPVLWWHPGLTFPDPGSPDFPAFAATLDERVRAERVAYIVIESANTEMDVSLMMFPALMARTHGCPSRTVATWTVRDLCH